MGKVFDGKFLDVKNSKKLITLFYKKMRQTNYVEFFQLKLVAS
jgi:hypothetical protein